MNVLVVDSVDRGNNRRRLEDYNEDYYEDYDQYDEDADADAEEVTFAPSMNQIQFTIIFYGTVVMLAVLSFAAINLMLSMPLEADSLLFGGYVGLMGKGGDKSAIALGKL